MGERHARRQHQRGDVRPVERAQILRGDAAACASATDFSLSSKATTSAPPACSARADNRPEPPSPKTATFLPAKVVTGIKDYLSLSEARPASASTTATIQKRMTICGSVQPSCSK